jgi:CheY-like chemotaxis protein
VIEAGNGREALDVLAAHRVDLVLLDVHMPVMDGVETLDHIRASKEPWSRLPIIAVTADAMAGDRERLLARGMDSYISKPIDKTELIGQIRAVLKRRPSPWPADEPQDPPLAAGMGRP